MAYAWTVIMDQTLIMTSNINTAISGGFRGAVVPPPAISGHKRMHCCKDTTCK